MDQHPSETNSRTFDQQISHPFYTNVLTLFTQQDITTVSYPEEDEFSSNVVLLRAILVLPVSAPIFSLSRFSYQHFV
jgi:hypothetical protein